MECTHFVENVNIEYTIIHNAANNARGINAFFSYSLSPELKVSYISSENVTIKALLEKVLLPRNHFIPYICINYFSLNL